MFEVLLTCTTEELYHNVEILAENLTSEEMAREYIIRLFQRTPELTEEQEKKLHQLGRKVRKKFGMKPVRIDRIVNFSIQKISTDSNSSRS